MRGPLLTLIFVCLFSAFPVSAQTPTVDETRLTALLRDGQLLIDIPLRSVRLAQMLHARLEVLDENDAVAASAEFDRPAKTGLQKLALPIPAANTEKLLWYRLRYTVSQPGSPNSVTDTVAISEIMPEIFELQVTAPHSVFAGMNVRAHVIALHPYSKRPVRNVDISGTLQLELDTDADEDEMKIPARGRTNSEGIASLEFKIPPGIKLDYDADLTIEGRKNGVVRMAEADLDISENSFVYLYTDKPLYQPGQKLYIRGLYLDTARRPIAGKDLEIEIEDEEGETVLEKTITTSRFGVVGIEWQIPPDFKLGKYRIDVDNEDRSGIGLTEFKVSRYDLPNFSVNVKPAKPYYLTNETTAEVTVDAKYLFGKAVQGGSVRIVEERERTWNFSEQEYDTDEGESYEGTSKRDGTFSARVSLAAAIEQLKKDKWKRFGDVKFAAHFTDATTNRTEQKRFDIRISKEPIHIYLIRPSADPNPAIPFQFYVSAFYADGAPAKVDLNISGYYNNAHTDQSLAEGRTNSYGAAKCEVKFPEKPFSEAGNEFNFRIRATDREGNIGTFEENVYVDPGSRQIRVKTNKTIYAPNEPILAKVISTQSGPVFVDVAKNSSVIWSKQISLAGGGGSISIPYRPDFKGELTITAYYYDGDDSTERSLWSKTVIFPTPSELAVGLSGLKGVYRPGEDARLAFHVRNGAGSGVESALGIVVLDKAIEERARTEQLRDNMTDLRKLLGTADAFGELRRRDLDKIDTTKPISNDLQLAAEYLLANKFHSPRSFASESYVEDFGSIYRLPMQRRLEPLLESLRGRYQGSSEYPGDATQLASFAAQSGFSLDANRDAWNTPFYPTFRKDRGDLILELRSASADKAQGTSDDFQVAEIRFQWFAPTLERINKLIRINDPEGPKPRTTEELTALISAAGVDLNTLRDAWDRPVSLATRVYSRGSVKTYLETVGNLDGARQEVVRSKVVEQEIALHSFISRGPDAVAGNYDDFSLGSAVVILSERDVTTDPGGRIVVSKGATSSSRGAIGGTITDANGAVIPGAKVSATNSASQARFESEASGEGFFLLANLPSGRYSVRAESPYFKTTIIENVIVSAYNLVTVDITLEVGDVSSTVEVTSGGEPTLETSNSSIGTSVTRTETKSISAMLGPNRSGQTFTPRVREYFPETLVWQPELITDKSGRALVNFKLADSLTTWKLYAFGSTESGEFGLVEREVQTFQPFFAELDPPKILTEGDEISLPVPVRNYTNKRQRVSVSMEQNPWSRMPNGASRQVDIAPNSSQNAVFDFIASSPIKDGKQRVSALARKDGDSIEKPVTVKPNGREEIRTHSETFQGSTAFNIDFPEGSFPTHRSSVLKIYPNLLAHVGESVEGLLQRPHGCGEQTTSSTYPNLMILKLEKDLGKSVTPQTREKARSFLVDGYKRLLNYQTPGGGFSYWGRNDPPNAPLTAYIIRFLTDAEEFIDVDNSVAENAKKWLDMQQSADGSWSYSNGSPSAATAYILQSLLHKPNTGQMPRINLGFGFLEKGLEKETDPYVLANTALIALKLGNRLVAEKSLRRLADKAQSGKDATFWAAGSTPFYGWGRAAEIETTAFAVKAFAEFNSSKAANERGTIDGGEGFIANGLKFILANKDSAGVWYSTQTTVNVLNTLIALQRESLGATPSGDGKLSILVNGSPVREVAVQPASIEPILIDLSQSASQDSNRIELKSTAAPAMFGVHTIITHYSAWGGLAADDRYFDLRVVYDKTGAKIGEEITCSVEMRRKNYTRYGMVLTEIGLPPGADVERPSLEAAKAKNVFSRYDVLPDKVVIYSWNASQTTSFSFKFKLRYGINAQTPASVVYDYYNPEAQAVVAPLRFSVR